MRRVHCKSGQPFDVYIGRTFGGFVDQGWGNPFVAGRDGTRDEVIAKYAIWVKTQPDLMARLPELAGKTIACWCSTTQSCHGDTLLALLEMLEVERSVGRATENP